MKTVTKFITAGAVALICVLLTCMSAMAIDFPLPINGRLDFTDYAEGQIIKITNSRTGISEQVTVNSNSEYLYDWSNSDDKSGKITKYVLGDKFTIEVLDCSGECKRVIDYTGQPEIFIAWDMSKAEIKQKIQICTCDTSILGILGLIAAFILSIGGGMQIYRNRKGGITILHRHRGITGYHNPDTQHRNVKYRHARLSTAPVQYAKDVKKIEEKGGLI